MCHANQTQQELIAASAYKDRLLLWLHQILPLSMYGPKQLERIFGPLNHLGPSDDDQCLVFDGLRGLVSVCLNPSHGWVEAHRPGYLPVRVKLQRDASIDEAGQLEIHAYLEMVLPAWTVPPVNGPIRLAERPQPTQ